MAKKNLTEREKKRQTLKQKYHLIRRFPKRNKQSVVVKWEMENSGLISELLCTLEMENSGSINEILCTLLRVVASR
jgi:hypothetical protein